MGSDHRPSLSRSESGKLGYLKTKVLLEAQFLDRQKEYLANPHICAQCNLPLAYKHRKNKFCNRSCAASFNNKGKYKWRKDKEFFCLRCGLSLMGRTGKKFCSVKCCNLHRHSLHQDTRAKDKKIGFAAKFIQDWKDGIIDATTKFGKPSRYIRQYIFEKFENKCFSCSWTGTNPTTNTIPLEIHHIDGDSFNNTESNLVLICPNCHSLTPTSKGANKGKGRFIRRERYREGKSS